MKTIGILDGLVVKYDETESEELKKIIDFINKYDFLFTDFDNENNKVQISIYEFNEVVENIVKRFVESDDIKQLLNSKDILPSCYISYLILKAKKEKNSLVELPENITIELLQFIVSIKYYNYDIKRICETLLSEDLTTYNKIFEQMKEEHRIDAYNYCLKCASGFLEEYDSSMLDNLEDILERLTQKNLDYINTLGSQQSKLDNLRQIPNIEFDILFKDFLIRINAPKEWFNFYKYLKINNLINFEYSNDIENGECYFDSNDQLYKINIISDGTIRTFVTFVHEFAHYVSLNQNPNINISLLEFPSIYFENIASEFLQEKGYEKGIINEVLNVRNSNNLTLFGNQILQFKDIVSYKKSGPFSIEERINFYKDGIKSMNDFKISMIEILKNKGVNEIPELLTLDERNPVEVAYKELDAEINEFVQSGLMVLNGYQYLVGSLLSFNILDIADRNFVNENMINITNKLGNYSISSITQLFGIDFSTKKNPTQKTNVKKQLPSSIKDNKKM